MIRNPKKTADDLFNKVGFADANLFANLMLDMFIPEEEEEINFWLDVKNYLITLNK